MHDDFEQFVEQLQERIDEDTRAQFGETFYRRWKNPLYMAVMPDPDAHSRVTGDCGDTIEMFLKFEQDRVARASFQTDGCGPSGVCGSYAAELAIGKKADDLLEITGGQILAVLGNLPEEYRHCAYLAANALHEALNEYMADSS